MRPLPDSYNIVVLGAWNPSIFSPEWALNNLADDNQCEVKLAFPLDDPTAPRKISFEGISVFPGRRQVLLAPDVLDIDGMKKCSSVLVKILGLLKHTPLSSAGVNFHFSEDNPSALISSALLPADSGAILDTYQINGTKLQRALKKDGDNFVLNLGIEQNGAACKLSFNFHYDIADADGYVALFSSNIVEEHLTSAIGLAANLYECELEAD